MPHEGDVKDGEYERVLQQARDALAAVDDLIGRLRDEEG